MLDASSEGVLLNKSYHKCYDMDEIKLQQTWLELWPRDLV